jgi:lysophospholipase L1-like esterase|tara:strand:- start:223 stop:876 length:654 start_codon:yes stop_codon:yes gene_type:complete
MSSFSLRIFAILCLSALALSAAPEKWGKDIAKFEAAAKANPHPKGALLFVGSSSIRMWDLKSSFPKQKTINHGFGGSELEDSLYFADRIIIPHAPAMVLLYAGDNDINKGKTANRVVDDYKKFIAKIHATLPKTRIIFLPIKPSLSRWEKWPEMKKANLAIQNLSKKNPLLVYLDTATPMLGDDGKPMPDLFKKDGLHLNNKGYQIWNKVVKNLLKN